MADYRHAGMGWPNGSADNAALLALPSSDLLLLNSEHWHHDEAVEAGKHVLWRAIARRGRRPAEVGYNAGRYVNEALRHVGDVSRPPTAFIGWNELDLNDERGDGEDDYDDLPDRFARVGSFLARVVPRLRDGLPDDCDIHFGAWTPDHHALEYVESWRSAVDLCDVVDFHGYDSLDKIRGQYNAYRTTFPDARLALTEWHCRGDAVEERRVLQWLADMMAVDHRFDAAYRFIWEWFDAPEWWSESFDVVHQPEMRALFMDPPTAAVDPPHEEAPVAANPWEFWTAAQIAAAAQVDVAAVEETWPHVVAQLDLCRINRRKIQVGVIGTIAVETGVFRPIREGAYLGEPEPAETHRRGLTYYPFYGRGDVQLTHRSNYAKYTAKLANLWGVGAPDLVLRPDDALDQDVSGAVIAMWFRDERALPTATWPEGYSLQNACDLDDDEWIRRLVYGGRDPAGQARIARIRAMLEAGVEPTVLTYNPAQPPERQVNNWACSIRSATWALKSVGVAIDAGQLQDEMVPGTVTSALGLLDGRGYGLAAILGRHLPAGTHIEVLEGASYSQVLTRAGRGPICAGSHSLYHWLNIAAVRPDGVLVAPNPAPNWQGVGDELTPEEFARWSPWNIVWVEVTAAEAEPPRVEADLATLVGVAYHEAGVIIPALVSARQNQDWGAVEAVISFLRRNDPDR